LLTEIINATDPRITIQTNISPQQYIQPNEIISVTITFTPDVSINPVNSEISLIFECNKITISILGKISAPGLVAEDMYFGKVRLYEEKTMTRKIVNAGNINIDIQELRPDIPDICFEMSLESLPKNLVVNDSMRYTITFIPTDNKDYSTDYSVINNNSLECKFVVTGTGVSPNIENIFLD
jgi:hypothetical protein